MKLHAMEHKLGAILGTMEPHLSPQDAETELREQERKAASAVRGMTPEAKATEIEQATSAGVRSHGFQGLNADELEELNTMKIDLSMRKKACARFLALAYSISMCLTQATYTSLPCSRPGPNRTLSRPFPWQPDRRPGLHTDWRKVSLH